MNARSPGDETLRPQVAYFSMEIAIDDSLPTYCGGLGVLAGDHLRAAADLGLPVVGLTLLYRGGYFTQSIDAEGNQHEAPVPWSPEDLLERLDSTAALELEGRTVTIGVWRHWIVGCRGQRVPVLFLDTDLAENDPRDRGITDQIYSGDERHRLRQEAVLGIGGVRILENLGLSDVLTFHMNEGHSALLTLELLRHAVGDTSPGRSGGLGEIADRCVFTTHTPVPEGHDQFGRRLVKEVLGEGVERELAAMGLLADDRLNMTVLGMSGSRSINAVSLLHAEVSRRMFPRFAISSITNGVHVGRWVSAAFVDLYDRHISDWRRDNVALREAAVIPLAEVAAAHRKAKESLVAMVAEKSNVALDPEVLTLGIARRAAAYKRLDLLLTRPDALREMAGAVGPLQIVYSGKAHPADDKGKSLIARVYRGAAAVSDVVKVVYLENYSLDIAAVVCAGADIWVNTPIRGHEASGTSGMKAAVNGVPSLSVLDGWWPEGHVEGITGWAIGDSSEKGDAVAADHLYEALRRVILPLFYESPDSFASVQRSTIALNGSYFTAERMVRQYADRAYGLEAPDPAAGLSRGGDG